MKTLILTTALVVMGTSVFASNAVTTSLNLPAATMQPPATEEFRTSTGASCRQVTNAGDGSYFDSGATSTVHENGTFAAPTSGNSTTVYFRFVKPLNVDKTESRLDCSRLQEAEDRKMAQELRLLQLQEQQLQLQIQKQQAELERLQAEEAARTAAAESQSQSFTTNQGLTTGVPLGNGL